MANGRGEVFAEDDRDSTTLATPETPLLQPVIEQVQMEYIPGPNRKITLIKVTLAIAAVGSVILYLTPSQQCSDDKLCGEWLKDFLSKQAADMIFFVSGSFNLALMSIYYGVQSVDKMQAAFSGLTPAMKVYQGVGVTALALTQLGHIFITAASTHSKPWQIISSVLGYIPTALFTAANLPKEIPTFKKEIEKRFKQLIIYTTANNATNLRYTHYKRQHELFKEQLSARWRDIISRYKEFENQTIPENEAINFIFTHSHADPDDSVAAAITYAFKMLGYIVGSGLAGILSYNAVANGGSFFEDKINHLLADLLGLFFSLASTYTNFKLIPSGIAAIIQSFSDFLRGIPYDSLQYSIHTNFVRVGTFLSCITAPFSYAVISSMAKNVFTEEKYPNEDEREALRLLATIAVCFIHYRGSINCTNIMSSALNHTTNNRAALMFEKLEKEVEKYLNLSLDEFIEKIENRDGGFTREQLALFHLREFEYVIHTNDSINSAPQITENNTSSWWKSKLAFCISSNLPNLSELSEHHPCLKVFRA